MKATVYGQIEGLKLGLDLLYTRMEIMNFICHINRIPQKSKPHTIMYIAKNPSLLLKPVVIQKLLT